MRAPSHDRLGQKIGVAGQPVVTLKRPANNLFVNFPNPQVTDAAKSKLFNIITAPRPATAA